MGMLLNTWQKFAVYTESKYFQCDIYGLQLQITFSCTISKETRIYESIALR